MGKQIYKLVDEKGRVLLPMQLRQKAELEKVLSGRLKGGIPITLKAD